MKNTDLYTLLNLNKKEQKVLGVTEKALSVAEIARKAELPRMTTHYILQRFVQRGIVKRKKRNKTYLYEKVSIEKLFVSMLPQHKLESTRVNLPLSDEAGIVVYQGLEAIYEMYERICTENVGKRVYTIQTTFSTEIIFQDYTHEQLDKMHDLMTENKLIFEDIVEEDFFEPIIALYPNNLDKILQPFLQRMLVTHVLPKKMLSFQNDMIIFKNVAVFIDWKERVVIEIRNQQIVAMCLDFFSILKQKTKRIEFKKLAEPYYSHNN